MSYINVKFTSQEDFDAVISILLSKGYSYHGAIMLQEVNRRFPYTDYPVLCIGMDSDYLAGNSKFYDDDENDNYVMPKDFTKIVNLIYGNDSSRITIHNVGDYNAVISNKNIKVGCQTITHEKFQEIAEAVKKVRK